MSNPITVVHRGAVDVADRKGGASASADTGQTLAATSLTRPQLNKQRRWD